MLTQSKICAVCGREITWRKKWEKNWDEVKYCGEKCRRSRSSRQNGLEEKILSALKALAPGAELPLESLESSEPESRELLRQAARRLAHIGALIIIQNGKTIDPANFKGPISIKLKLPLK